MFRKNKTRFPDFRNIVSTDNLRLIMNYAIVENGKLIGTNSYVIGLIDLKNWLLDENGEIRTTELENIEGKIFNIHLLTKLAKPWVQIIFKTNSILFEDKNGLFEETIYSGFIDAKKTLQRYINYDIEDFAEVGLFPEYKKILPEVKRGKLTAFSIDRVSVDLRLITAAADVLKTKKVNLYAIKDGKNSPILATPILGSDYLFPEFSEMLVIMPINTF